MMKHNERFRQVHKSISVRGCKSHGQIGITLRKRLNSERGSISVVVIGLFVITVASLMVMTDVSALVVAKRSLVQATEAAAQRGVHTLDKSEYYQGKGTVFTSPMAIATDTLYGLGAGVWTRDTNTAYRAGREIQAGRVWTNCYHAYPAGAAFGGYKSSGIGRETHKMMLDHYQQTKNLLVSYSPNKLGFF